MGALLLAAIVLMQTSGYVARLLAATARSTLPPEDAGLFVVTQKIVQALKRNQWLHG